MSNPQVLSRSRSDMQSLSWVPRIKHSNMAFHRGRLGHWRVVNFIGKSAFVSSSRWKAIHVMIDPFVLSSLTTHGATHTRIDHGYSYLIMSDVASE